MAYVTQAILQNTIGMSKLSDLTDGGSSSVLAQCIALATADVESALQVGGYTLAVPSTVYDAAASDCPSVITLATVGAFMELAYGRNDLEVPQAFRAYLSKLVQLRNGEIEIVGSTPSESRSVGGVLASDSDSTSPDARTVIFGKRSKWAGF